MAEEFDVDWLNLNNYKKLEELDLLGWYKQISFRNMIYYGISYNKTSKNGDILKRNKFNENYERKESSDVTKQSWLNYLKNNPIDDFLDYESLDQWRKQNSMGYSSFDTYSVYGTRASYIWRVANDDRLKDVWIIDQIESIDEEDLALFHSPIDLLRKQRDILLDYTANITINLAATDEQIYNDFRYWLVKYREVVGLKSNKKNFTRKIFSNWIELRILPYIDLMLVAAIEGKKITQTKIANIIFSDEFDIAPNERLRRTTRPLAELFFRDETEAAMEAQLMSDNT